MTEKNQLRPGDFTAESLFELISKQNVVKSGRTAIRRNEPGLKDLAAAVNGLISAAFYSAVLWAEENERIERARPAIQTLVDILPLLATDYDEALRDPRPRPFGGVTFLTDFLNYRRQVVREHAAMNRLFDAAVEAQKLGLPKRFARTEPLHSTWMGCARSLEMFFHAYLPGHTKAAGYRFIQAISPHITHDNPTYQAVESHLKKRRDVNRGNRQT